MIKAITTVQKHRYTSSVMLLFALFFVAVYILSVFATVQNVAARAKIEGQITKLSSNVDDLEFQYISMKSQLTSDNLAAAGLEPVAQTAFLQRTSGTALALQTVKTQ